MKGYIENEQKYTGFIGFWFPYISHSGLSFERLLYFLEDAVCLTFCSVLVK